MRLVYLPLFTLVGLPSLIAQTCEPTEPPQITALEAPEQILGDGAANPVQLDFADPDAGVRYLHLVWDECPTGCSDLHYDLTQWDPGITTWTEGTIPMSIACTNDQADDFQYAFRIWLEDEDKNTSSSVSADLICVGTATTNGTPVLTDLSVPKSMTADVPQPASLSFVDENGGVSLLHAVPVSCPDGVVCADETLDVAAVDPRIPAFTEGTIGFNILCENPFAFDVTYAYAFSLEDSQGNVSAPLVAEYTCLPGSSDSFSETHLEYRTAEGHRRANVQWRPMPG